MDMKLNLSDELNFSKMDLTAPNIVVKDFLSLLPEATKGFVNGEITEYDGPTQSHLYNKRKFMEMMDENLGRTIENKYIDIQDNLEEQGEKTKKYQCSIYTKEYEDFQYRMFFMEFGISNYPVQLTLAESIARDIPRMGASYIAVCASREELENLMMDIIGSKRVIGVMQKLIRIGQIKQSEKKMNSEDNTNNTADSQ